MLYQQGIPVAGSPEKAPHYRIAGYWRVPINDIDSIRAAIVGFGPIMVGGEWPKSWFRPVSGVVPAPAGGIVGGHERIRIGYDLDFNGGCWLERNSWGNYAGSTGGGNFWIPFRYESADGRPGTAELWEGWKAKDITGD
jgi:hypothetical protein